MLRVIMDNFCGHLFLISLGEFISAAFVHIIYIFIGNANEEPVSDRDDPPQVDADEGGLPTGNDTGTVRFRYI